MQYEQQEIGNTPADTDTNRPVLQDAYATSKYCEKNKDIFTGKTAGQIATELTNLGYKVEIRKSTKKILLRE